MEQLIPIIPALPLAGFALTALFGRRLGRWAGILPVGLVVASWAVSMAVVATALGGGFADGVTIGFWQWIPAGTFVVDVALRVDNLAAVLLIVVTTIGMLIHIYSVGYMGHDPGYWRFFAYLNFFMFAMLLLVLADNFLVLFVAWELVGLASYLLIGFWYRRRSAALAAKKAFLVNRVGDVGFALGIMMIWVNLGTLNIAEVLERIGGLDHSSITVIALLIFAGAVGKSAQFPLHVWLPDAMEGPTPVSALIHAATMVNAGVYLVARCSPIFALTREAMLVVAAIGIFTAILAATIALTQTDIKRVLAYSTLSQLGYMFAALGVGAYAAAIFHLMAHGFVKGLLFLGSGSVIHAVADEQDMRKMGGLAGRIRITHATMLVGALAISGIPPLAIFFSKDEILGEAFKLGAYGVWAIGLLVAGLTAFYMFRLMGLTFYGTSRVERHVQVRIHESPPVMTLPLIILALFSIGLGVVMALPLGNGPIRQWLEPVFAPAEELLAIHPEPYQLLGIDGALLLASVVVSALGLAIAIWLFGAGRRASRPGTVRALSARVPFLYRASINKWWFDDLNDLLFVRIGGVVAGGCRWFDEHVVDGTVNGLGRATTGFGRSLSRVQTGRVQNYAMGIALGLIVMAGSYLILAGR